MLSIKLISDSRVTIPKNDIRYLTTDNDTELSTSAFRLLKNTEDLQPNRPKSRFGSVSGPPLTVTFTLYFMTMQIIAHRMARSYE